MSRKNIIAIAGVVAFSFLVVIILYALSDEPLRYSQNFTRVIQNERIQKEKVLNLKDNSYYFAGATKSQIFLGNRKDSLELLITDRLLSAPQPVRLSVSNEKHLTVSDISLTPKQLGVTSAESLELKNSAIEIDSPYFYIKAGNLPGIFKGTIGNWHATRILDSIVHFDYAVSMVNNSLAFQTTGYIEGGDNKRMIGKISVDNHMEINSKLLEGQGDNYFSTKGVLCYSRRLNRLVYTYAYRNQYLVTDTSLNLLHKVNTIDSVSQARIKPVEVSKGNYSMASPSAVVNRSAQVYEDLLFVNSDLMASNETREVFDHVSVIDVYDLKSNKYQYSFYLPDYENVGMYTFAVIENRIFAFNGPYVISYSFKGINKNISSVIN
jgi:hypothetical protein